MVVSLLMPTECQCRRQCHDCPMSSPLVTCSTPDCQAFAELVGDDQWSTMLARKLACNLRHANSVSIIYSRHISTTARRLQQATRLGLPADLQYFPDFFSIREQRALLDVALRKLDISERRSFRLRRKELMRTRPTSGTTDDRVSVQSLFLPDEYYDFQEGHYDGVIRRFREMHVSSLRSEVAEDLLPALDRLEAIYPSPNVQTHLLHLASDGEISPHVDNVGASGSWILGISLGAPRLLKLENISNPEEIYTLPLQSGSVYIQRDTTRFDFQHSVLLNGQFGGKQYNGGQRMSIMVRDRHKDKN